MAEGLCAAKTSSFSFLASLLSGSSSLFSSSHSHLFNQLRAAPAGAVVRAVRQSGH